MCNLSEVIIRSEDTCEQIKQKIRIATIFGTLQSTLTNFRYLRKVWKTNQEEERLLGVSMTGIMDHLLMSGRYRKDKLKEFLVECADYAKDINAEFADILGIPHSKQIGLIKPSGTVSQLCGTSSGIHPRYSPYYLRRVTQDNKDPLTDLMIEQGIPHKRTQEKTFFSFPIKSPEYSVCAKDMGAMEQLELWKIYQGHWCDGNPSQTIYYTDDTFLDVQAWVYKNFDLVGGLSFFPFDDFIYDRDTQPYLPITEEEYNMEVDKFPKGISWDMSGRETDDNTTSSQEMACAGGACEL